MELLRQAGASPAPQREQDLEENEYWYSARGRKFTIPYNIHGGWQDFVVEPIIKEAKS